MALPGGLPQRGRVFRYESWAADAETGTLTCRYSLDGREFTERVTLPPGPLWRTGAARGAARLVFLLAGVSYYKTAAPPVIDLGQTALTEAELTLLREFYLQGLGEFAYRNTLDLTSLRIEADRADPRAKRARKAGRAREAGGSRTARRRRPPAGAIRRRDRLDRRDGVRAPDQRRRTVHHEQARRPVRGHRGAGRGHRAARGASRAGDRSAVAPLGRARLPQRARAGDRDPVRDRGAGCRAHQPGRGGDVQRVVGIHPHSAVPGPAGEPPVLQERGLRGGLPPSPGRRRRQRQRQRQRRGRAGPTPTPRPRPRPARRPSPGPTPTPTPRPRCRSTSPG